jgi:hypothetical protein
VRQKIFELCSLNVVLKEALKEIVRRIESKM